jgi:hypothetical protein
MTRVLLVGDLAGGGALPFLILASGHDLFCAPAGDRALAAAAEARPEVVLYRLPGPAPADLASRLRAVPGCRGALLVALVQGGAEGDHQARAPGFDLILGCPLDRRELSAALGPPGARWRVESASPDP